MNVAQQLEERRSEAERILLLFLPEEDGSSLTSALRYSFLAGGKRLRPVLMRESWLLFGGEGEHIGPFMAALEMIHTASLMHDDLPAIDNDDFRRGKKTAHVVYGEAVGLLAGDAMLNLAYETLFDAMGSSSAATVEAAGILARKGGLLGMLGGQGMDVVNEKRGRPVRDKEELFRIFEKKTCALFEAALMCGAILAGARREDVAKMEQVGRHMGLAFQIRDDILDVTSTTEKLGKPVLSDEKSGKVTSVTLMGLEGASALVQELTREAVGILEGIPGDTAFLEALFLEIAGRDS